MNRSVSTPRVNYFKDQYLRRQDFSDEQSYQIAQRRRHNIGHHSWGIVVGLELALEEGNVVVRPGLAVDGFGRELYLPVKKPIATDEFVRLGSNRLDVWLYYENQQESPAPNGYKACSDDSPDYYRISETPRVFVERAAVSRVVARRPKAVATALLDAGNQLQTPDDPLTVWPVYLGRITYVPEEKDPAKVLLIDASDRTYAGVMAEAIDHPASASRVEVGSPYLPEDKREVGGKTYTYRSSKGRGAFSIFVPSQSPSEVELVPRFQIDEEGKNYLRGTTTLHGNLQLASGGAVQFLERAKVDDLVPRNDPSIYRSSGDNSDELRVDLGKITESVREFVIGFTADDGSFQPSMKLEFSIPPGGNAPRPLLTVYGDLKITGLLDSPDVLDRAFSEDTFKALLASFQAGSVAAGHQ